MSVFVLVILELHPVGCEEITVVRNPPSCEVQRKVVIVLSHEFLILIVKGGLLLPHVVRTMTTASLPHHCWNP